MLSNNKIRESRSHKGEGEARAWLRRGSIADSFEASLLSSRPSERTRARAGTHEHWAIESPVVMGPRVRGDDRNARGAIDAMPSLLLQPCVIAPGLFAAPGRRRLAVALDRKCEGDGAPKGAEPSIHALRRRAPLRSGTHASRRSIAASFAWGLGEADPRSPRAALANRNNLLRPSSRAPCARTVVSVGRGPGHPGSPADEAGRAGAAACPANWRHRLTPLNEQVAGI